jgi:hypothetical protein
MAHGLYGFAKAETLIKTDCDLEYSGLHRLRQLTDYNQINKKILLVLITESHILKLFKACFFREIDVLFLCVCYSLLFPMALFLIKNAS